MSFCRPTGPLKSRTRDPAGFRRPDPATPSGWGRYLPPRSNLQHSIEKSVSAEHLRREGKDLVDFEESAKHLAVVSDRPTKRLQDRWQRIRRVAQDGGLH